MMAATAIANTIPQDHSVFRPALPLMAGRLLTFAATFLIPVVLARTLSQGDFGTYKQLFLIHSTCFLIGQIGMAQSLYYFIPHAPGNAGRFAANAMLALGLSGFVSALLLVLAGANLAAWLNNPELAQYLPWIAAYLLLTLLPASLEIVLISRANYLWASFTYALSDFARAAGFLVPALLFGGIEWLLRGAVIVAAARFVLTMLYFRRSFGDSFRPDRALLSQQANYSFVFAGAVVIEVLQASLPQYAISYLYDPATLAVFAVGCLQIPLVEIASSPASDIMMVKMQESLVAENHDQVVGIWHDTTWKLAAFFIPLTLLLWISARDLFVVLFTERYLASVPVFLVWAAIIPLSVLQVDGVLRVYAKTRVLLLLNLLRLAVIGGLLLWSLSRFGLPGGAGAILLGALAFKIVGLLRIRALLKVTLRELLPWRSLASLAAAGLAAAITALAVRSQFDVAPIAGLFLSAAILPVVYVLLLWQCKVLPDSDRLALRAWLSHGVKRVFPAMDATKRVG